MQNYKYKFLTVSVLALSIAFFGACNTPTTTNSNSGAGGANPDETAATVNGKAIKLQEIERVLQQQTQGQAGNLSQLELAQARLQILETLIQQEVMFQKAEKEQSLPSDEEVTTELNRLKQQSGLSQEKFDEELKKVGQTDADLRNSIKKQLAIKKLTDKITGKIESPKENEVETFFNSNKDGFKNKRGAQLAAIVISPTKVAEDDTTTNEIEAQQKAKEVGQRVLQGADFSTVARESSEDPNTRLKGGDWRYFSEDEMKQALGAGVADYVMNKMQNGQIIPQAIPLEGNFLIIKLQRKQEKDEDRTLETPGVRQEIADYLINSRKQLLAASYQAIAMDEAKIENLLAKKVVENPNDLSGARPASAANANANAANTNANTTANANSTANANANTKPANANANAANKPANANK